MYSWKKETSRDEIKMFQPIASPLCYFNSLVILFLISVLVIRRYYQSVFDSIGLYKTLHGLLV